MPSLARLAWSLSLAALPLTLTACPDKSDDSSTDAGTGGATSTASTGQVPTTSAGETSGGSVGASQGEVSPTLCEAACQHLVDCSSPLAPSLEACVMACEDSASKNSADCVGGAEAWWGCLGAASCNTLSSASLAADACELPYAKYLIGCGDCPAAVQPNAPTSCAAVVECADAIAVSFVCSDGTCACQVNDSPSYASCPEPSICTADAAEIRAAAAACCGVPFPDLAP